VNYLLWDNQALAELRQAARLAPDNARYAFVYVVALYSMDRQQPAVESLEVSLKKHLTDRDILSTLIQYQRKLEHHERVKVLAARFCETWPNDPA